MKYIKAEVHYTSENSSMTLCNNSFAFKLDVSFKHPHKILRCDPEIAQMLTFTADDVTGQTIHTLFGPNTDSKNIIKALRSASLTSPEAVRTELNGKSGNSVRAVIACHGIEFALKRVCQLTIAVDDDSQSMFRINCNKEPKMQEWGQTLTDQPDDAGSNSADGGKRPPFAHEILDCVCIAQNASPRPKGSAASSPRP